MPIDMQALARAGATARLTELQQEIHDLQAAFPDLDGAPPPRKRGRSAKQAAAELLSLRKRTPMSAAAKKAASARMKAYWAARKSTVVAPATMKTIGTTEDKPEAKPAVTRTISPEGRARISAAQRKRWKAAKRAKKR
jgi:hypothetical protein